MRCVGGERRLIPGVLIQVCGFDGDVIFAHDGGAEVQVIRCRVLQVVCHRTLSTPLRFGRALVGEGEAASEGGGERGHPCIN
ncbi:MAG TPA: hypothetical protein VJ124_11330 [Pyrinomonadaceae bacterium]|nr:hypothetical protein [Pyrinomonadaceae bacterium]